MAIGKTRRVSLGGVLVGGGAPVSVQSMTNTNTADAAATLAQIGRLAAAGCEIARVAVPDQAAAAALREIAAASPIPVVADIHFDHRLALAAIASGVHGLRLNPGNIDGESALAEVAAAAARAGIPIRVGANSGSVKRRHVEAAVRDGAVEGGGAMAAALVASALEQCRLLEERGFRDIKVSLKASDVRATVAACRRFAEIADYPQHLGITEAGGKFRGTVKSAVGLGALLLDGIGDTIRVSLTADPVEEVEVAIAILESVGLRRAAPEIISCPTCGRTQIDLIGLAAQVENMVAEHRRAGRKLPPRKIAIMGCAVNGPGEAREADIGIAGAANGEVVLFRRGQVVAAMTPGEALAIIAAELAT